MALVDKMNALSLEEDGNPSFDVFFIYKTTTSTSSWVRNTCRDLERIHIVSGSHEKDFMTGRQVSENIVNCINRSKKVGIVITPDFLKSHWCKYDLSVALENKMSNEGQILPLYLNVALKDIPLALKAYTGIDVSGPRTEWWDKLVTSLRDLHPDNVYCIYYYFQKTMEAIMNSSIGSAIIAYERLSRSPLDQSCQQLGISYCRSMLLARCGITLHNRSLQIDFATLFPDGQQNSKLLPMRYAFNEFCLEHYIMASLNLTDDDKEKQIFQSDCEIKFYGKKEENIDSLKLALSFPSPMEIKLKHGSREVLSISNESANGIIARAAETQTDLQLRSKRSRGIRHRFSPYRISLHSNRGCKNYRNYRKVLFTFPQSRFSGRYTFFRSNFEGNTQRCTYPSDNEKFLLLRKLGEEEQDFVF